MRGSYLLAEGVSYRELLLAPLGTAAGPLYPVLHWLVAPLIGFDAPAIRWLNPVLLGGAILSIRYAVAAWGHAGSWARSLMILGVPIVWVTTGMALTEIPAMAFVSFSVAATAWAMTATSGSHARVWAGFIMAGVCFGIATLGRQPYFPAAGAFAVIAIFKPDVRWPAVTAFLLAWAVPAPVFLLWGGFVEPDQRFVGGIDFAHGALAFCYLSILYLILAPGFFAAQWKWSLGAAIVGGIAVSTVGGLHFPVAAGITRTFPPMLALLFQAGVSAALVGGALALTSATAINLWLKRDDSLFVLFMLLTIGLTATAAANVFQFSSRYLMTAFPFALLAIQPYFQPNQYAAVRFVVGAAIGGLSLVGYYAFI